MALPVIRIGSMGEAVEKWQYFLAGESFLKGEADGIFGPVTEKATKKYQRSKELDDDGVVGSLTYAEALKDGFDGTEDVLDFPPKPDFLSIVSIGQAENLFGKIKYIPSPTKEDKRLVKIVNKWDKENIVKVHVPELKGVKVGTKSSNGTIYFHKKAVDQLKGMWAAWEKRGLRGLVLTYEGSFIPRFIGGTDKLSNHAFGIAFDINYDWNKWGHTPAQKGTNGSVRELVPIAHEFGFYWGGHFIKKDGMHFEVAKLLSQNELQALFQKYGLT